MTNRILGVLAPLTLGLFVAASSANAQTKYLHDFPGWTAVTWRDGTVWMFRSDRNGRETSIYLLPMDRGPVTTSDAATARASAIRDSVAGTDRYAKRCSTIQGMAGKPNGMGLEFKDDEEEMKCFLFVGTTKQGRMFANLWVDEGDRERNGRPVQHTAGLFLHAAVARIEGRAILPADSALADLASLAKNVPRANQPKRMLVVRDSRGRSIPAHYGAISLFENSSATDCSGWDPGFFTPRDLIAAKATHSIASFGNGPCRLLAWKVDPDSDATMLFDGKTWAPATSLDKRPLIDATVLPFATGEKLNLLTGSKARLYPVVQGKADIRTLKRGDAWFTPDGLFLAADIGLGSIPLTVPKQVSGRYHVDGHLIVLELDTGPVLIGLAGKTETDGKMTSLLIGATSYGVFP